MDEATAEQLFGDDIAALCSDIVGDDLTQVTTKDAKVTLSIKNGVLVSYNGEGGDGPHDDTPAPTPATAAA